MSLDSAQCRIAAWYRNKDALVFVVDANDPTHFDEAAEELQKHINRPEVSDIPVLVFANKQDLLGAAVSVTVSEALHL